MENGSGLLGYLRDNGPSGIIIVLLIIFYFQLSGDIGQLRTEVGQLRTEMKTEINQLRTDLVGRIDRLNERIDRHIESDKHTMAAK